MRRLLLIALCVLVIGIGVFFILAKYEFVERLETHVTGNIPADHIDRIWFSPRGELVGFGQKESQLVVRVWSASGGNLIRERTLGLPANPVFAVSAEGVQAAWVEPAGVRVANLIAPEGKKPDNPWSGRRVPISSLAFTGSDKLAALYRDGEIEILDIGVNRVSAATHLDIADPGLLISNGSYLAAYSRASGSTFVFDTSGDRFSLMEHKRYPTEILALTLSPLARFAVATGETVELPNQSISAPGKIRSLAFIDRNRFLVGGDFRGIYVLGPNRGPQQVADADPGTTILTATGPSSFVFGNGRSLVLASGRLVGSRVYMGLARPSGWLLTVLFGLCSPLVIYFLYSSLALVFRKAQAPVSEPLPAPEKDPEGPIPNGLVDACQNGDCVLWAGLGLGAQAGLPTWSAFLPELVNWAAQNDLAPAGRDGEAADRIAAAFETRERDLHAYLRQRFRVASEVSQAHRLAKEVGFQALVTTALDNLLDRAFPFSGGRVYTAGKCEDLLRIVEHRDFFLLKPFGDLDELDTIRIGPAQCAEAIKNNPTALELMQQLFDTRVFLFMGASLEGLERDLAILNLPTPTERKHYALFPTGAEGWEAGAGRLNRRYAIEAIPYSPSTAQHAEVVVFLTTLIELIRRKTYTEERYGDE